MTRRVLSKALGAPKNLPALAVPAHFGVKQRARAAACAESVHLAAFFAPLQMLRRGYRPTCRLLHSPHSPQNGQLVRDWTHLDFFSRPPATLCELTRTALPFLRA